MFFNYTLLLLFCQKTLLLNVVLSVVIVTGVIFLKLLWLKVIIVDLAAGRFARFPGSWQRSLESFFCNIKQIFVILHVHTQVSSIFFNFSSCWFIIFIKLFLQNFKSFSYQGISARAWIRVPSWSVLLGILLLLLVVSKLLRVYLTFKFLIIVIIHFIAVDFVHGQTSSLRLCDHFHLLLLLLELKLVLICELVLVDGHLILHLVTGSSLLLHGLVFSFHSLNLNKLKTY